MGADMVSASQAFPKRNLIKIFPVRVNIFSGFANVLTSVSTRYQERIAANFLGEIVDTSTKEERQKNYWRMIYILLMIWD